MPNLFAASVNDRWAMERNGKQIVREWNREIETEMRRLAAGQNERWGKVVVWTVLELIWLVGVFAVLGLFVRVRW